MKLLIVLSVVVAVAIAQRPFRPQPNSPQQQQQPPQQPQQQYPEDEPQQFSNQNSAAAPRQQDRNPHTTPIPIVRFDKEQGADGSYKTSWETGNNIVAQEEGFLKNVGDKDTEALVQHGSYSYTAPDGTLITVTYTADEQGFRAEGAHIPTPPPVPEEIQKSLELIYAGIRAQEEEAARNPKFQQKLDNQDQNNPDDADNYPSPSRFRN